MASTELARGAAGCLDGVHPSTKLFASRPAPKLHRRPMSRLVVSLCVATLALACGRCPDGTEPTEGTCTCSDGTLVSPEECDLCAGSERLSVGDLSSETVDKSIRPECGQEVAFRLDSNAVVQMSLEAREVGVSASVDAEDQTLGTLNVGAGAKTQQEFALERGAYAIRVSAGAPAEFTLKLNTEPTDEPEAMPDPGEDKDEAHDLGVVPEAEADIQGGYVGPTDEADYFRFRTAELSMLTFSVRNVLGSVWLGLHEDAPLLDASKPFQRLDVNTVDGKLLTIPVPAGDYYFIVSPQAASFYELHSSVEAYEGQAAKADPGGDWSEALDLGSVGGERLDVSEYVGGLDEADYYRLELETNGSLTYTLSDVRGNVRARLYEDAVQINLDVAKDLLDSAGTGTKTIDLGQGTYYFVVTPWADSLYTLSLSLE
jgi:hypothetical protein